MYELPENHAALSIEDLDSNIDQALDAFRALNLSEASSDEDLDTAEAIKASLETLRASKAAAVEAVAARNLRIAALAEAVEPEPESDEPTPDPEAEPAAPEAEPAEAVLETVAAAVEVVTPDEVITPTQEVQPVAASASPSPVARAAAAAPEVIVPAAPRASLIAAADVPGYANGAPLEGLRAAATAVLARTKGLPKTNLATASGGVRQRYGAALIQKTVSDESLVQAADGGGDLDLVWRAGDESRLPNGSLVAAGGWCAPSETLYDLCQYETVEGIISMPEMQVSRGGIRFTSGPDFSDIYDACGFFQTEADAIAGECKDCCMVDCPPFDEIRLDAIGMCVKSPLLTEAAYPELVQRFLEGALVAHQHKINKYLIDSIALAAGTPTVVADSGSFSKSLGAIELTALGIRYSYRMSQTATIETIVPFWAKTALRMDLAMQNQRNPVSVTDAELNAWFAARNLSVQWVYDYQNPVVEGCEVTLPNTVTVLMYPVGTWVKGGLDVISLDAVYDSPNLEANQYTALFVEEGILAVQKCTHTCAVTIPVCISGKGVLEDIDICQTAPALTGP
ncbi:MAG: major capsid protein [Acidimicrobiia bacterium]|nr:major capsid protein [Acidimicrobiia bacterium]